MNIKDLLSAEFWENIWQRQQEQPKKQQDCLAGWNKRAEEYYHNVASPAGHKRVEETLDFLDAYGVLDKKLHILDLGSGPGNFTLALAARGHEVVALDPAEKMLAVLKEKLRKRPKLQHLVTTVAADWHTLSLQDCDWLGRFDLVFASLTPGIRGPFSLQKAMLASKQYVFLSQFAGARELPVINDLSRQLLGKQFQSAENDALLPLNWLYTKGYRPVLHFARWEQEFYETKEQAVARIAKMLGTSLEITPQVLQVMAAYVEKRLDSQGYFCEQRSSTAAMLLWDINKNCINLPGESQ